jgi:FkbM family methyltransferase
MLLPRRHVLPYLATDSSPYARNLVDLAALLAEGEDTLVVLDVGANIGDSTLMIREGVRCRTVCVEGDPQWLSYLEANVGNLPDVAIEASLLSPSESAGYASIVHEEAGSSRLVPADAGSGTAMLPAVELISRHPELERVRLVKTDTDGFDVALVPVLARIFERSRPVIFFEFDAVPTRLATPDLEPSGVFEELASLGYDRAVVWTNGGHVLGTSLVSELAARSVVLDGDADARGYHFWDVAVAHRDDPEGIRALRAIVASGVPAPRGAWPAESTP